MSPTEATEPRSLFPLGIIDVQRIGTAVKVKILHDWVKTFRKNTEETLRDEGGPWVVERNIVESWRIRTGRRYNLPKALAVAVSLRKATTGAVLRIRNLNDAKIVVV